MDDNISLETMGKYAPDMFLVLQEIEDWKNGDDNEFDSSAMDILNKMREESK